mmetsp:Transcript_101327/g.261857  ORF Transcript_101327/g.261857 Transcript_101327/m.261857 type:complete len:311 (+) Transcript_101327:1086-2018(+)
MLLARRTSRQRVPLRGARTTMMRRMRRRTRRPTRGTTTAKGTSMLRDWPRPRRLVRLRGWQSSRTHPTCGDAIAVGCCTQMRCTSVVSARSRGRATRDRLRRRRRKRRRASRMLQRPSSAQAVARRRRKPRASEHRRPRSLAAGRHHLLPVVLHCSPRRLRLLLLRAVRRSLASGLPRLPPRPSEPPAPSLRRPLRQRRQHLVGASSAMQARRSTLAHHPHLRPLLRNSEPSRQAPWLCRHRRGPRILQHQPCLQRRRRSSGHRRQCRHQLPQASRQQRRPPCLRCLQLPQARLQRCRSARRTQWQQPLR